MLLAILYLQYHEISNIYIAYLDIHYRNIIQSYNQTALLPFSFDIRCVDSYNFYMRNLRMLSLIISCAVLAFSSVAVASDDTKNGSPLFSRAPELFYYSRIAFFVMSTDLTVS